MLIYIILTRAGVKNAKRISNPPTRSFSIVATRLSQCNIINSRGATTSDVKPLSFLLLFCFTYLYILYLFYLFLYCFYSLFIINLLLLLIILGFWGVLGFWVGVCLRLGLICVEISMVVGIFVGGGVSWLGLGLGREKGG